MARRIPRNSEDESWRAKFKTNPSALEISHSILRKWKNPEELVNKVFVRVLKEIFTSSKYNFLEVQDQKIYPLAYFLCFIFLTSKQLSYGRLYPVTNWHLPQRTRQWQFPQLVIFHICKEPSYLLLNKSSSQGAESCSCICSVSLFQTSVRNFALHSTLNITELTCLTCLTCR